METLLKVNTGLSAAEFPRGVALLRDHLNFVRFIFPYIPSSTLTKSSTDQSRFIYGQPPSLGGLGRMSTSSRHAASASAVYG
jgi:hypothetical protein